MYRLDMTYEAFKKQWDDDFDTVRSMARNFYLNKCMRRVKKLPADHFPRFILHKVYVEKSHNTYITACPIGRKKDFVENHYTTIYPIGIVKDDEGRYNGVVVRGNRVYLYSPHFFKRYAERLGKQMPVLGKQWEDTLGKYIAHAFEGLDPVETIYQEKLAYERVCVEGIEMLIGRKDGVYIGTTFFTEQMLDDRQLADLKDSKEALLFLKSAMMNSKIYTLLDNTMNSVLGKKNVELGNGLTMRINKPNMYGNERDKRN